MGWFAVGKDDGIRDGDGQKVGMSALISEKGVRDVVRWLDPGVFRMGWNGTGLATDCWSGFMKDDSDSLLYISQSVYSSAF